MDTLKDSIEFDHHIRIVPVENTSVGLKGYIAIHRKIEGQPSLGATRLWKYEKDSDALDDALRLAHLMSYKSMASGFSYGGAKATLIYPEGGIQDKHAYFKAYTNYVNELHGDFVTGSDVGMSPEDVQLMSSFSPYIVGSNVRSNYFTSLGVLYAIQVVLQDMFDSPDVSNRTFAIQGVGNTGSNLLRLLIKHGAKNIYISDINEEVLKKLQHEFPFLIIIPTQDIHKQKVDVFSPCALSHAINTKTIHELDCLAIVGSANNQLESRNMGDMLH
ncbi:hypothetical protein KKG82_05300 [Patescibacteria group bacterium]|nr:hypothetical protein [Patescibacteria group bacterium]